MKHLLQLVNCLCEEDVAREIVRERSLDLVPRISEAGSTVDIRHDAEGERVRDCLGGGEQTDGEVGRELALNDLKDLVSGGLVLWEGVQIPGGAYHKARPNCVLHLGVAGEGSGPEHDFVLVIFGIADIEPAIGLELALFKDELGFAVVLLDPDHPSVGGPTARRNEPLCISFS